MTEYHEAYAVGWRWLLYGSAVFTLAVGAVATPPADLSHDPLSMMLFFLVMFVASLMAMLGYTFSTYELHFDGTVLRFGYHQWKVELPLERLTAAHATEVGLLTYGGLGWRVGIDGTIGYIARLGPTVIVGTEELVYGMSCADPTSLLGALASAGVEMGEPSL